MSQDEIKKHFADLKKGLEKVSDKEWEDLPEPKDLVKKTKKQKQLEKDNRYVPITDSAISSAIKDGEMQNFV